MIPKIFHRIWLDEKVPDRYEEYWARFQELHPTWEFKTWDDSSKLTWMQNHDTFLESNTFAGKSDVVRYEVVNKFGGIYVDTDVEPLRAFDDLLSDTPFVAWEDDKLLCPTVIGSPKEHPAMKTLLDDMPAWFRRHKNAPPNQATGPFYITDKWLNRTDVTRYPPRHFYPVGWWEKELLGGPYPPESYSVHHWVKGWSDNNTDVAEKVKIEDLNVVILCPWRGGDEHREYAWSIVRPKLEELKWPIFTGDSVGPWNRSAAINAAAEAAGDWDVAVIVDTDTIDDYHAVSKGIRRAVEIGGAVVPWHIRHKLSSTGTKAIVGGATYDVRAHSDRSDRTPAKMTAENRGGAIVVSRDAWDAVNGFDEKFAGWGLEDVAFRLAVKTLAGGLQEIKGKCTHLWHPSARGTATSKSKRLYAEYVAAKNDKDQMRELVYRETEKLSVSILIPFRDDGGRKKQMDWIVSKWKQLLPDAQIVVAADNGIDPFSKTEAVNNAFMESSGNVLIVCDADTWFEDMDALNKVLLESLSLDKLIVPWDVMHRLSADDSQYVMKTGKIKRDSEDRNTTVSPAGNTAGGLFVINRVSFNAVNGMDPRFRGWGFEDVAFRRSCDAILGKSKYYSGDLYCLDHDRPKKGDARVWGENDPGMMNSMINIHYIKAERQPKLMHILVGQHPLGEEPQPASLPRHNQVRTQSRVSVTERI